MTQPVAFQRIYRDFVGPEYRADETVARTVIAAMNEAAEGYFAASNDPKAPQWSRKANAHAWAGMVRAIEIVTANTQPSAAGTCDLGVATATAYGADGKSTPGLHSVPSSIPSVR